MKREPKQERAIQTKATILRAAAEVFDEVGYAGASINKIISRAGVTQGAMYFHFTSKEALAQAVMNAQPTTIVPKLDSEGLQRLVDITMIWALQMRSDPLLRAGVRLTTEQGTFGVHDATPYTDWAAIMVECLRTSQEKGELLPGVDPEEVAHFVVAACTGMQMYSEAVNGRADLADRAVSMWRLMLPAIAVPTVVARTALSPERFRQAASAG
jgi:AcrR family transcriptional regulator